MSVLSLSQSIDERKIKSKWANSPVLFARIAVSDVNQNRFYQLSDLKLNENWHRSSQMRKAGLARIDKLRDQWATTLLRWDALSGLEYPR